MTSTLTGQHAVVTGGGRGLGATIASALAANGANVTVMGRTSADLDSQSESLRAVSGIRAQGIECDVSDPAAVARAFAAAVREFGSVHVLINNAGVSNAAPVQEISIESWMETLAVNLTGTFLCMQQVLPAMIAAGSGRIVNIASTAGLRGYGRIVSYTASKHGVVGLARAVAVEIVRSGVTVNAVCPGYIEDTAMIRTAIENVTRVTGKSVEEARAILAKQSPGGRLVTAQEVADVVLRLCWPESSGITGQAIEVGGGEVLG